MSGKSLSAEAQRIISMYSEKNMTFMEIANELGASYSKVRRVIISNNVPNNSRSVRRGSKNVRNEDAEIIYKLYSVEHKSMPEISKITGWETSTISSVIKKMGGTLNNRAVYFNAMNHLNKTIFSDSEIDDIKNIYLKDKENGVRICCAKYNVSVAVIRRVLRELQIDTHRRGHRKYFVDEDYFSTIDTRDKAYILGYIITDGCVHIESKHSKRVSLSLNACDTSILEDISKAMGSTYPITFYDHVQKSGHISHMASLQITSNKLCDDLIKLGVTPHKSSSVQIDTSIPKEFYPDLLRGLIDGDGCVTFSNKKPKIDMCGNEFVVGWVKNYCETLIENTYPLVHPKGKTAQWFRHYTISGRMNVFKILDVIYANSPHLYLPRKYEKYIYACDHLRTMYGKPIPYFDQIIIPKDEEVSE